KPDEEQVRAALRASERETADHGTCELENEDVPPRRGDDVLGCLENVRERRAVALGLSLRIVELGRVERDPVESLAGNPARQIPRSVGGIREEGGKRPVEVEERLPLRVVTRRDETRKALLEPERGVRLPACHQHGRPVLQRDADDTRSGRLL